MSLKQSGLVSTLVRAFRPWCFIFPLCSVHLNPEGSAGLGCFRYRFKISGYDLVNGYVHYDRVVGQVGYIHYVHLQHRIVTFGVIFAFLFVLDFRVSDLFSICEMWAKQESYC